MQLVAYGAQDLYLTHEPQITFFKVVYRRHTNFAVESIEQTISGTVAANADVDVQISRNGDLVNNILLELTVSPDSSGTTQTVHTGAGFSAINEVQLQIGGQEIDKQYGHWMMAWHELTASANMRVVGSAMWDRPDDESANVKLYVPLMFWFCRDNGLALPLIALQYHPVNLKIKFSSATATGMGGLNLQSAKCFVDYVFLDTDERKKFAQTKHEYLIEQVQQFTQQVNSNGGQATKADLIFNHPVKELIWFIPPKIISSGSSENETENDDFNNYDNFLNGGSATLRLNNTLRFKERAGKYFDRVQVYQHHSGQGKAGLYVYSFALNPEKHQPSGSCNFSRIDSAILEMKSGDSWSQSYSSQTSVHVYAHNYNVLRIMSGMGGLAYSN
jgi:hypothetical protein